MHLSLNRFYPNKSRFSTNCPDTFVINLIYSLLPINYSWHQICQTGKHDQSAVFNLLKCAVFFHLLFMLKTECKIT